MSGLSARLSERDFTTSLVAPDVVFTPQYHTWSAIGGPLAAEIAATGREADLWDLIERLRCPVELLNEFGETVWWGFVNALELSVGGWQIGVTLDSMANKVAVVYSYVEPGTNDVGLRATTDWAQNNDSIATYGTLELKPSLAGATTLQAEALRAAVLDQRKYPIPVLNRASNKELTARLHCLGWWETLRWRYLLESAGLESYQPASGTAQVIGATSAAERLGQSFQLAAVVPWAAYSVRLPLALIGAPTDNVIVELCADAAGSPGTVLATSTIAAATLTTTSTWIDCILDTQVILALSTTYWISVRRSGSLDADNHYELIVGEALGYTRGVGRLYDGSAWVARSPDADAAFQVTGVQETTEQIRNALTNYAPFIAGVIIDDASGLNSSQYRDGDSQVITEVEALLKGGTSAGRRLLATVTRERFVRITAEPVSGGDDLRLMPDGTLQTPLGVPIDPATCPVGMWLELREVIPATVDLSKLADPTHIFVESAEYHAVSGLYTPEPRTLPSVWDLGMSLSEG